MKKKPDWSIGEKRSGDIAISRFDTFLFPPCLCSFVSPSVKAVGYQRGKIKPDTRRYSTFINKVR